MGCSCLGLFSKAIGRDQTSREVREATAEYPFNERRLFLFALQPDDRKQSSSSVLSLLSSLNAPLAAILTSAGLGDGGGGDGGEKGNGGDERGEDWTRRDFRVSIIHNGWLTTASGKGTITCDIHKIQM